MKYLTQIPIHPTDAPLKGSGILGNPGGEEGAAALFAGYLTGTIGLLTIIASIWFLYNIFFGAIGIIGAGGDAKKMEDARSKITSGIIGIVIVISAIFIVDFIGSFLGFNMLDPVGYMRAILPETFLEGI